MQAIARRGARCAALAAAAIVLVLAPAAGQEIEFVAVGDIEWSRAVTPPDAYFQEFGREVEMEVRGDVQARTWPSAPLLNLSDNRTAIRGRLGVDELDPPEAHHLVAIEYDLDFETLREEHRHPFQRMRDVFRDADLAFGNLEMPLSSRARHTGAFLGHPGFADALRWAGFDVVSTANNHSFDGGHLGLIDTKDALREAGVGAVGTGRDLEAARRPWIAERDGVTLAFLGYTWRINVVGSAGFPKPDRSGAMPLDPILIREDIERVRGDVDHVVLSFHWGVENSQDTHPDAREFAREMIDAGADIVLGHHPHVPRGVEAYDGGVIFYSLGNYTFGHNHTYWGDQYVARLSLTPDEITEVELLPIAGEGHDMAQPYLLEGPRAREVLEGVRDLSRELDTELTIVDDRGLIRP